MKKDIHPKYIDTIITCSCGAEYPTRATVSDLRIEICSNCHPFFTGKQKLIDTEGRVERFKKRYSLSESKKEKPK